MKSIALTLVSLMLILLAGCSDKETPQARIDPAVTTVTMSDLVQQADKYTGKTVTISGRFGGMCADGADFYFKDKLDLIEVIPPAAGLPDDVIIGTPLKIQGVVMVRGEHEEEDEGEGEKGYEEGGEPEPEVKIRASVIQTNRS